MKRLLPAPWLSLALWVLWLLADGLARLSGRNPLVNPVMISVVVVGALLVGWVVVLILLRGRR